MTDKIYTPCPHCKQPLQIDGADQRCLTPNCRFDVMFDWQRPHIKELSEEQIRQVVNFCKSGFAFES